MYYLFPFGKVKQGAKIIIYGAGMVGQQLLSQVRETRFAEIVAIADRAYMRYPDIGIKLIAPEKITELEFDFIVIALESPDLVLEIKSFLVDAYHIDKEKIIWGCENKLTEHNTIRPLSNGKNIADFEPFAFERGNISLGVCLWGGLGDNIISKKFLENLREATDSVVAIDLYCSQIFSHYAKAIFQEPWYRIYDEYYIYEWNKTKYDVALCPDYILRIDHINVEGLKRKSKKLGEILIALMDKIREYGLDAKPLCEYSIHFARSKYQGWDAYIAMGHGIFKDKGHKVNIPLQEAAKKRFNELKLPQRYITLNYGWGTKDLKKGLPAKIWLLSNYMELTRMLRKEFPEYSLVQLGTKGSAVIEGVDHVIQGESLEIVKYILLNSALHIDCEGGLVHLATQLGTKCVVLFGPTPESYFGYKSNINISANVCKPCYYAYNDFTLCARGLKEPLCMMSITPAMVMDRIVEYLSNTG
ncbi:MAG: glycosyltransferase family 9 protein [Selenomonadaceae bacterium]|nr:glycosyltransferase family 9 protein [Selenomonadaceae bacterium]